MEGDWGIIIEQQAYINYYSSQEGVSFNILEKISSLFLLFISTKILVRIKLLLINIKF